MPTVLRVQGYRFFFFSLDRNEPLHIHVEKAEGHAKFWLVPVVMARSRGFRGNQLAEIHKLVEQNKNLFKERWHEYFGG